MCNCVEGVFAGAVYHTQMRVTWSLGGMGGLDHTGMRCRWGSGQQGQGSAVFYILGQTHPEIIFI